ncbi:MAG: hypothetical protein H0U75_09640 [Legionella sp.]|nr:hypothetical protein [Legionella sp.]
MLLDGNRFPDSRSEGESRAMRQALSKAQMTPADIDYLNTHGSSSMLGDAVEVRAIRSVFGDATNQVWLNATKGIIGHCLWSAGIVEAIATLLQMNGDFVHGNLNLDTPIDTECRFAPKDSVAANIGVAMSNSFGFGGINTSIIFTRSDNQIN